MLVNNAKVCNNHRGELTALNYPNNYDQMAFNYLSVVDALEYCDLISGSAIRPIGGPRLSKGGAKVT